MSAYTHLLFTVIHDFFGQAFVDSNWGLFWVTTALALVTLFYAIQTWKLVRVPYMPILRPRFSYDQEGNNRILKLRILNIGPGMATDVIVEYSLKGDSNILQNEKIDILESKQMSRRLNINHLQPITGDYYSKHKVMISIKMDCKDVFHKRHHYETELDVSAAAGH